MSSTWDEDTWPHLLRPSLVQRTEATADDDSTLGLLMRQTVNNTAAIEGLRAEMSTLVREVRQHSRGIESDRPALAKEAADGAAKDAAKHTSNRLAVLMTALFSVYEVSSPYLRDIWHAIRHHQ